MGQFDDIGTTLADGVDEGMRTGKRSTPERLDVAEEEGPAPCGCVRRLEQDDLRGVVVALRIEAKRRMQPPPGNGSESPLLALRHGTNRNAPCRRRREK